MSKIYIAGKITGNKNYKDEFIKAECFLERQGHEVMNPAYMGKGFLQAEYLHICKAMIDVCDIVCFLPNWEDSKGASYEMGYAEGLGKKIEYMEVIG